MSFILRGEVRLKNPGLVGKLLDNYIKEHVKRAIAASVGQVRVRVMSLVEEALDNSDEAKSILDGLLRQEFGLEDPSKVIAEIKQGLVRSVGVFGVDVPGALGGMKVEILDYQFERQLAKSQEYISVNSKTKKTNKVDWLSWLLFSGSSKVVNDAKFQLFSRPITSRAKLSVMVPSPIGYAVSPDFAGTAESNWFDKILAPLGEPVLRIMLTEVQRAF